MEPSCTDLSYDLPLHHAPEGCSHPPRVPLHLHLQIKLRLLPLSHRHDNDGHPNVSSPIVIDLPHTNSGKGLTLSSRALNPSSLISFTRFLGPP